MKTLLAVSLATIYGVILRIMFGLLNNLMEIMSISFLILAPIIIGFLTIILIPKEKKTSLKSAFFKPWLTSLGILIITLILKIEGSICWIMIYPLFALLASIGGLLAYYFRNLKANDSKDTDSGNPNNLNVSFMLFIPILVGIAEGERTLNPEEFKISETLIINASPKEIWHELTNVNDISSKESKSSFSNLIGFPKHLSTSLDTLAVGGKRKAIYENGLYFDEIISKFEIEKTLILEIKTDPNNIPPTVMDEHIIIGGKHIDILQDIYTIEKLSEKSCRLTLSSRFFINTPFNWYASIWSKYLMSDILKSEIKLIDKRVSD